VRTLCSPPGARGGGGGVLPPPGAGTWPTVPTGARGGVGGAARAFGVRLCGVLGRPGAVAVGWLLQLALIASGMVVGMMYGLGLIFAALWWASVHYGRKVDVIKAARAAAAAEA